MERPRLAIRERQAFVGPVIARMPGEHGIARRARSEANRTRMSGWVEKSGIQTSNRCRGCPSWCFLIQVSRPGLWSTTALFYLMPLGHGISFRSWTFWIGLFYVLFPLGLVLYGVNDIADAEADRYNPRKGTFLFGSQEPRHSLAALRWQIAAVQIPFLILFLITRGPRILWWFALLLAAVGIYNAPRIRMEGPPAARRADSGELFAGVCAEQLAQSTSAVAVANIRVRRAIRDALTRLRRGDGHRAGPDSRTENDGNGALAR